MGLAGIGIGIFAVTHCCVVLLWLVRIRPIASQHGVDTVKGFHLAHPYTHYLAARELEKDDASVAPLFLLYGCLVAMEVCGVVLGCVGIAIDVL